MQSFDTEVEQRGNKLSINKLRLKMRIFLTIQRCPESIKVTVGSCLLSVWHLCSRKVVALQHSLL